jgi:hypothetical protein
MMCSHQQHKCLWLQIVLKREEDDRGCANFGEMQLLSGELDPLHTT